jgi:hypothetical protein
MPTISNKTHRPLVVPLPGGKTLHLGPGKTGQVAANAVEDPRLKKLVEGGEIEFVDDDSRPTGGPRGGRRGRTGMSGHSSGGGIRRSGDR